MAFLNLVGCDSNFCYINNYIPNHFDYYVSLGYLFLRKASVMWLP